MPSLVTSIIGGIQGRNATKKAAAAQTDSVNRAIDRLETTVPEVNQQMLDAAGTYGGNVRGAAGTAAAGVEGATTDANALLESIYKKGVDATSPYAEAGVSSLADLVNLGKEKFEFSQDDPSYQFRLQEGQKALEASAAARGGLNSGGTLKALTRYGQGMASTEYQAAFERFLADRQQRGNVLGSLAGMGQTATGQQIAAGENYGNRASGNLVNSAAYAGDVGMRGEELASGAELGAARDVAGNTLNLANQVGNYYTDLGDVKAADYMGRANAWNSMLSGIGSAGDKLLAGGFDSGTFKLADMLKLGVGAPANKQQSGYAYVIPSYSR